MNMIALPEPFTDSARRKLRALGAILCKSFPDDVNFALLMQKDDRIVATSNLNFENVCLLLQDFIDSPPED